ncbi:MAG: hypothetical protein R3B72_23615 [Polyangiaceae bacterium]
MGLRPQAGLLFAATLLSWSASALGQGADAEVRIDQLQPPSPDSPFTRAEGPISEFDTGIGYGFRFTADYGLAPLRTVVETGPDAGERKPVAHALLGHAGAGITPFDWMSFELGFTFAAFEKGRDDLRLNQRVPAGKPGAGDLRVGAHFRPYLSKEVDVSLGLRFWAPIGMPESYLTGNDRFFRLELVPSVAGDVDLLTYGCTLGLAPTFFAGRDGDRVATSCAAQFKLAPTVSLGVEPHVALFAFSTAEPGAQSEQAPGLGKADIAVQFEPLASLSLTFSGFQITAAGGPGLGNAPGTPKARAMLTFAWNARGEREVMAREPEDRDLDGVIDDYDGCPDEAGSKDNRGCPVDQDQDGDGIVEGDACPHDPGPPSDNELANGCPDKDNDHVADPIDDCPDEPGDDTTGCPRHARLRNGDFVIEPPIKFSPSRANLGKVDQEAIVEAIGTLRANPKVKRLQIKLGTRRSSPVLTDRRAAAILQVFNDQNVDSAQYELELDAQMQAGQVEIHALSR